MSSSPDKLRVQHVIQKLPNGWLRKVYLRTTGATAGRKDIVLVSPGPNAIHLRSSLEIERYARENKITLNPKVCRK